MKPCQEPKLIALVTSILALLVACVNACTAQIVQDCCTQAIAQHKQIQELTSRLNTTKGLLEKTRQAGDTLLRLKEQRMRSLETSANQKLSESHTREKAISKALSVTNLKLDLAKLELENELLRGRFLGFGRRAWVRKTLKRLQ